MNTLLLELLQLNEVKAIVVPDADVLKNIPPAIKAAFDEYGFDKRKVPFEKALAVRKGPSWFGILFQAKTSRLFAIDFVKEGGKWEVQNDEIDIKDVDQFKKDPLTKVFF